MGILRVSTAHNGLVAGSSPAGPTNENGRFLLGWKWPLFPNRLRYDANLFVSRSSVDQSIAIKGARLPMRYPFEGGPKAPVLLSCPPIPMLVFLGSHPLQLEAKSLRLHSHCMHSAHENPSAHVRRTSLLPFRKLAEIIHFSIHLAMKRQERCTFKRN